MDVQRRMYIICIDMQTHCDTCTCACTLRRRVTVVVLCICLPVYLLPQNLLPSYLIFTLFYRILYGVFNVFTIWLPSKHFIKSCGAINFGGHCRFPHSLPSF